MSMSLAIWIAVGIIMGVAIALAFKHRAAQMIGAIVICTACAVAGGWLLGLFGLAIGGAYIGAAVNAAIGTVVVPIIFFTLNIFDA